MPNTPERPRRIRVQPGGPLLVEGPVEVVGEDGRVSVSHRFEVAVCTCRRTRTPPWCDTSHRHHKRADSRGDEREGKGEGKREDEPGSNGGTNREERKDHR